MWNLCYCHELHFVLGSHTQVVSIIQPNGKIVSYRILPFFDPVPLSVVKHAQQVLIPKQQNRTFWQCHMTVDKKDSYLYKRFLILHLCGFSNLLG